MTKTHVTALALFLALIAALAIVGAKDSQPGLYALIGGLLIVGLIGFLGMVAKNMGQDEDRKQVFALMGTLIGLIGGIAGGTAAGTVAGNQAGDASKDAISSALESTSTTTSTTTTTTTTTTPVADQGSAGAGAAGSSGSGDGASSP